MSDSRSRPGATLDPTLVDSSGLHARRSVLRGAVRLTALMNAAIHDGHEFSANTEVAALIALRTDGALRPRDLTAVNGMSRAGTTNMIDRLEHAGFVHREPDEDDRRGVVVRLTDAGVAAVDAMTDRLPDVFTAAASWLAGWGELFDEMGLDVGPLRLPAGAIHKRLEYVRGTTAVGPLMSQLYEEVFGDEVIKPHLVLHLLLLASEPEGTRPSAFSSDALLSSATTSDLLDRAERDGFVVRTTGRAPDRRAVLVTIAERGVTALEAIVENSAHVMATMAEIFFPRDVVVRFESN